MILVLKDLNMTSKEWITVGIAALGAILGIINTVCGLLNNRLRLKVVPNGCMLLPHDKEPRLSIDVINLSTFPVTITEVGVKRRWASHRTVFPGPFLTHEAKLPHRLEPRASMTAITDHIANMHEIGPSVNCAFAKTACGRIFYGYGPIFKEFRKMKRMS